MTTTETQSHNAAVKDVSVRFRLRAATSPLHERVDRHLGQILLQPDGGYRRFLLNNAAAVFALENALEKADVASMLPDWPERARSKALKADLADLGLAEPAFAEVEVSGEARAFGILYVLEGSRLGAEVIRRMLHKVPTHVPNPTRYLSHGQGKSLWPTFVSRLEASRAVRAEFEDAVEGACAAFGMFLPAKTAAD